MVSPPHSNPIKRFPLLGGKELDLYHLYKKVQELGGSERVGHHVPIATYLYIVCVLTTGNQPANVGGSFPELQSPAISDQCIICLQTELHQVRSANVPYTTWPVALFL